MALRRLYQLRAVALSMVICMSLVSCVGSKISQENFEKIQTGMALAQVQAILGEPTESSSVDVAVFSGTVPAGMWGAFYAPKNGACNAPSCLND